MVDYSINKEFDIHLTKWGDFVTVDGREEFEQDIVIQLHDKFDEVLGFRGSRDSTKHKIKLAVTRIAEEFDQIDSIKNIDVVRSRDASSTYQVEVTYDTGDTFSEEL